MPYYTDAHPDSGLILSRAVGVIATEEVFTAVSLWTETLLGDPRLAVLLIDHSEADISSIRMEDVKQVAEVSAKLFEALPELFTVALYGRNLEYALGRMWQSWRSSTTGRWSRTRSRRPRRFWPSAVSRSTSGWSGRSRGERDVPRGG
jgi:hypothetical protein